MLVKTKLLSGLLLLPLLGSNAYAAPEPSQTCPRPNAIAKTFKSGATWNLCAEWRAEEGLVLSQVYYAAPKKVARRVLGEASLAQLEEVFDSSDKKPVYGVTQQGLGRYAAPLTAANCPQGNIKSLSNVNICRSTQDSGYQYKYENQRQGSFFELVTHYNLAPRSYSVRWRFYENGIIEPALGISGQATSSNNVMDSFIAHAGWRLDFDLGTTGNNDEILELTSVPSEDRLTKSVRIIPQGKEYGATQDPDLKRSWVIRDGTTPYEGISVPAYDIVPSNYNYSRINTLSEPWLQKDIYFSKYSACERYASDNLLANCPKRMNSTARYVGNKEQIGNGSDTVVWYRQSYHHLARSDDNVRLGTVWSSFQLVPRDWHSQNQF